MRVLVVGGTRFFGKHLVRALLAKGNDVTLCTRGITQDTFGSAVDRIVAERTDPQSLHEALHGLEFDVVCDNLAYCSNDVRYLLDNVQCERYVMTSSCSVYEPLGMDTRESAFDPLKKQLVWCNRTTYTYDEMKRQAECALFQKYANVVSTAVRYPYVVGENDYTNRLYFYVKNTILRRPMCIDNLPHKMAFVHSREAGEFLAFCAGGACADAVNGANMGAISLEEVLAYVQEKTGEAPLLAREGEPAPYNGTPTSTVNTSKARECGFTFVPLNKWMFGLLDSYIERAKREGV